MREVRELLADHLNVAFHPGLFPGTTRGLDSIRFALVHLDADLYASTKAGLEWFWPRIVAGGAILLDDYGWGYCKGVERAVTEFFDDLSGFKNEMTAPYQLTVYK